MAPCMASCMAPCMASCMASCMTCMAWITIGIAGFGAGQPCAFPLTVLHAHCCSLTKAWRACVIVGTAGVGTGYPCAFSFTYAGIDYHECNSCSGTSRGWDTSRSAAPDIASSWIGPTWRFGKELILLHSGKHEVPTSLGQVLPFKTRTRVKTSELVVRKVGIFDTEPNETMSREVTVWG